MAAKGDVELIIRAKNEATKNLDAINKSLENLADQQKIVGDSAGKADDQLSRLGLELAKLRTNAQNLKALSTVSDVVDKAALALERQRQAAREADAELARVSQRQKELGSASTEMNNSLKAATAEVRRQDTALKAAKSSLGDLSREATNLASSEKSLQSAISSAQNQLTKRQAALDEATAKQQKLAQAIAGSEKVTKAQQNSLDAANRTLERRQKALDETIAREAELQQKLSQVRAAIAENTAAALNANSAYTQQAARVTEAATAAQKLKTEADGLTRAHRDIAKDVQTAAAAVERQSSSLKEAESEYSQVEAAAASARAAVAGTAVSTKDAGNAAGRAAVQVATFAARLAVLSGAGGATSKPTVIDPKDIREAEASLSQLGVTIRAAGNDAAKASVSSKEMATALKGVGQAQSTLQGISSAIGAQRAAVDGAQQAWKTAEAEVRRLAIAIKEADQPSEQLAAAFGKAQGAARLAKDEFLRQKAAADQIAQSLKNAGIGAGDLGSAEAALAPKIQRANDLMNQGAANAQKLGTGMRQAGSDAGSAAPQVNRLAMALGAVVSAAAKAGAATNPLRAFKNELVAMIAASAGLYAIKEQLESIWQAGTDLAANQSKFATAFGGIEEGSRQLNYAREVALNLKLPLGTLTKSYADLALAAKGTALEGKGAQDVFVAFAQTARVNGSSADDLGGVFRALTQIMSKGKVQAEELRGQLGDRMPGAMQLMAEGLGITTEKLDKMMEKGELTRETLLNMAAAASGRVAPQLAAALDSPAAKLADFQNRVLVFKETIAGSGFLDAVADAFDRMAKALSTPEAADAARAIGEGLADIVTWATELVSSGNLDTIVAWVKGLGVAWAGLQMASIITTLYGFVTAIGATTVAVFGLDVAMAPVLVGLGALASAVAVVVGAFGLWKLAEWAYDNFPVFAEGVMSIKNAALSSWDAILQFWEITSARLVASFTGVTAKIRQMWYGLINDIMSVAPEITAKIGLGDYAKEITARFAEANQDVLQGQQNLQEKLFEINNRYANKERERNKQLQDDIAGYHKARIQTEQKQEESRSRTTVRGGAPMGGTTGLQTVTAAPYVPDTSAADEKAANAAAKKRVQLEQNVANQMFGIRAQLEQKSAQTLDEQLAAVPAKYAKLFGQLTALGKDKTSQEWQDVEALIAQEQRIIRQNQLKKDERAAAKAERAAQKTEDESRKQAMDQVNALLQTRKNLQEQLDRAERAGDTTAAQELKEKLAGVTQEANDAVNGMIAFWQAVGGPEADLAIAKLEKMKLTLTKTRDTGILTVDSMGKAFGSNLKSGIDSFIDRLSETGDVFGSLREAFRQFAIDFLKQIAQMILQQLVFNALRAIGGGFFNAAAGAISGGGGAPAGVLHSGGTAGGTMNRTRTVSPALFQNAARFHNGSAGVPGLKSGEVPAILEAGETVRTEQQEKALADRMAAGGGAQDAGQLNIINTIDMDEAFAAAANSSAMGKTVLNHIKLNRSQIKSILG